MPLIRSGCCSPALKMGKVSGSSAAAVVFFAAGGAGAGVAQLLGAVF
jgi:hypothetical protein